MIDAVLNLGLGVRACLVHFSRLRDIDPLVLLGGLGGPRMKKPTSHIKVFC